MDKQTSSQNLFQFSVVNLVNGVLNLTVNICVFCVLCSVFNVVYGLRYTGYMGQGRWERGELLRAEPAELAF